MKTRLLPVVITAVTTTLLTVFIAAKFSNKPLVITDQQQQVKPPVNYTGYSGNITSSTPPADFQPAAEASVEAVVHIKTKTDAKQVVVKRQSFFGSYYEKGWAPPQMGSGSGVVISPDGYIVTNNHVVAGADVVTVTFDNRKTMDAKLIATDPSTDIAVIKIDGNNFPYMEYGNSDDVKLGQWVLAVGYPFSLDATVTAGIVSAKSRSLGINRTQSSTAIESFIQTDAAVNQGNSGGALVNTDGQLIGINAAIASPTGTFTGYSYAIPSNIVKKIADDIIEYGAVQRAFLGISYKDVKNSRPEEVELLGLDKYNGVYIAHIFENSAADKAGMKEGDFITGINGAAVSTSPELLEQIAQHKPGDHVSVTYLRNGKEKHTTVELKNLEGNTKIIKGDSKAKVLGANLQTVSEADASTYGIKGGVIVTKINSGAIAEQTNMQSGFIITGINETPVSSVEELQNVIAAQAGKLKLSGFYPDKEGMYYYGITLNN